MITYDIAKLKKECERHTLKTEVNRKLVTIEELILTRSRFMKSSNAYSDLGGAIDHMVVELMEMTKYRCQQVTEQIDKLVLEQTYLENLQQGIEIINTDGKV